MSDKEIQKLKKTIKHQDGIIGRLTREKEYLEDSERRRKEWLREAKKQAGFPDAISFDRVWEKALAAYLQSLPKTV